jgi:hypothetical protein
MLEYEANANEHEAYTKSIGAKLLFKVPNITAGTVMNIYDDSECMHNLTIVRNRSKILARAMEQNHNDVMEVRIFASMTFTRARLLLGTYSLEQLQEAEFILDLTS